MPSPLEIAIMLLAVASLAFYGRIAWRLGPSNWPAPGFGTGDYVLNGLLVLWWVFLITQTLGKTINVTTELLVNNALFNFLIIATIAGFLIGRDRNPVILFGLRWRNWLKELPLVGIFLVAIVPILLVAGYLVELVIGETKSSQDLLLFFTNSKTFTEKALLVFTAVVVAPVTEEVVFRGYLHGTVRQVGGRWWGILVSSLIFAGIHGHVPSLASLFVLGIAFALLYERTGSLWASMLMHAIFNSLNLIGSVLWPWLVK